MPKTLAPPAATVSIRAASLRLNTNERVVWRLLVTGALRSVIEPGKTVKVDAASLAAYQRSRGRSAPAATPAK